MNIENQKKFFTIILMVILFSVTLDIYQDWGEGYSIAHISTEILSILTVIIGLAFLWTNHKVLNSELISTKENLKLSEEEAGKWKKENETLIKGLSSAIEKQLLEWQLTPSEKEIAFMLLKGLSLKEIADVRSVSERTVRQQSISIYQKANLAGRAELSAFFLEDLLK